MKCNSINIQLEGDGNLLDLDSHWLKWCRRLFLNGKQTQYTGHRGALNTGCRDVKDGGSKSFV